MVEFVIEGNRVMKVILTEDVLGLGDIGETVKVRPGYGRNFLIPRGIALETGSATAKGLAHIKRQIESKKRKLQSAAEERARSIRGLVVKLELKTSDKGGVFGSIGPKDVAFALQQAGIEIDRKRVLLAEPIKKLGEYPVAIRLHQAVEVEIKLQVVGREASAEDVKAEVNRARGALDRASARDEVSGQ